ncbi:FkbM family methyltransferase [Leptospira brenneri]|uniref:FkbM family methyltransferase n=1 Tax=Leptospira brenneri TaxID=2023182 RepID=A0A2M9Y1R2_9LEPT|nr:FkbM family methyltransferase [Leptospira brenneri]PJZ45517.1 hypothetical protein CH361_10860 [Leptospira brenneri]TGK92009.1 FkbM family methyltransferase [Leptospira brenneri]
MKEHKPNFVAGLEILPFQDENLPIHEVITVKGLIKFAMYGKTSEFRVRTFFTKEPETLAWIDSFSNDDVFWDIGANIGCYSLYAARNGIQVCAFEPSPVNFWLLSKNIGLNKFGNIVSYPFALSNENSIVRWDPNSSPGSADNQLSETKQATDPTAIQVYSIDQLIAMNAAPFPTHIKIDVDGIEPLIVAGAINTLADNRLQSLMIEANENDLDRLSQIKAVLKGKGFKDPISRHEPYFDENYYLPYANFLFRRE